MTFVSPSRHIKAGAALLLATGLFAAAVAPAAAAPTWSSDQRLATDAPRNMTSFHRHFWRGTQMSQVLAPSTEKVALADDAEAMEAYCMDRFKSYDPATGTYLGYDGFEHPCP